MFGPGEVWGISFGSAGLHAVKMGRDGDRASVLEAVAVPYPSGDAAEGLDRETKVLQALQTLVQQQKLKRQKVAISVPGNAVFSKFITLPPVEKKRVPEIVKYESRQQIPFPIEEVVWDYQPVKADPLPGEEIEVALFAIRREIIQGYVGACLACGLFPAAVQAAPLAFCNLLLHDQPSEDPLVVLDVTQEGTELVIMDGERVWPRSIALGSKDLTLALQKKFQIPLDKAEELKAQAAKSKQGDRLFGVMKPVLQNLAGQVQRTLGFYKSQHPEARFGRILVVGDFFDIPGVAPFFKETLKYEFVRLEGPKSIELDEGVPKASFPIADYAAALGLGLQALGLERLHVNLILPELVQQRRQAAKRPWVGAAALLLGASVAFDYLQAAREAGALEAARTEAEGHIARLEKKEREFQEILKTPKPLLDQLDQLPPLLEDRDTRLPDGVYADVLREVFSAIPRNLVWIDRIEIAPRPFRDLKDAPPPPWAKDPKNQKARERQVLVVTLKAQKIMTESETSELGYVRENVVQKLDKVAYFERAQSEWYEGFESPTDESGQKRFSFTLRWYLDPDAYPARPAP